MGFLCCFAMSSPFFLFHSPTAFTFPGVPLSSSVSKLRQSWDKNRAVLIATFANPCIYSFWEEKGRIKKYVLACPLVLTTSSHCRCPWQPLHFIFVPFSWTCTVLYCYLSLSCLSKFSFFFVFCFIIFHFFGTGKPKGLECSSFALHNSVRNLLLLALVHLQHSNLIQADFHVPRELPDNVMIAAVCLSFVGSYSPFSSCVAVCLPLCLFVCVCAPLGRAALWLPDTAASSSSLYNISSLVFTHCCCLPPVR